VVGCKVLCGTRGEVPGVTTEGDVPLGALDRMTGPLGVLFVGALGADNDEDVPLVSKAEILSLLFVPLLEVVKCTESPMATAKATATKASGNATCLFATARYQRLSFKSCAGAILLNVQVSRVVHGVAAVL
jgi:hypothetical protein